MKFTPKKSVLLLLTVVFLLLAVQAVSAQPQSGNIFDSFKNIFGSDFGQLYQGNWWVVDLIVYLFFFGYIGKLALGKQFDGKGGSIGVVFGVAMAIALVAFEAKTGFQLGNLGPYALAVLVLALAFITWKFFHGFGFGNGSAAAFAVIIVYGTLATVASPLLKALKDSDNPTISGFASIINLLLLIAVIAVAWNGFSFVFKLFRGGGSTAGLKEAFTNKKEAQKEEAEEEKEKAEETVEEKAERRMLGDVNKIEQLTTVGAKDVNQMRKDIDEIIKVIKSGRGRFSQEARERIAQAVGDIGKSYAELNSDLLKVTYILRDLENTEAQQMNLARDALKRARSMVVNDMVQARSKLKAIGGTPRLSLLQEKDSLDKAQNNIETDIARMTGLGWAETKQRLEKYIQWLVSLESKLPPLFTNANGYLRNGTFDPAVRELEEANVLLKQLAGIMSSVDKIAGGNLKNDIIRVWKDLTVEKSLTGRIQQELNL